jgi:predicted nucleotidyltransferase
MTLSDTVRVRLEPEADILFALLFGSVARGEQREDSDLDVGVYVVERLTARERFDLRLRVGTALEDLGRPDVVVLNDAPPLLAHRALQGKPILTRDKRAYVRFFVRSLALAEDERHFRSIFAGARRSRVKEGRFGRP